MACYVCLEDAGELVRDACRCCDAPVHAECLRRWVAHSRRTRCAMCGGAYALGGAPPPLPPPPPPPPPPPRPPPCPCADVVRQVALVGVFGGLLWYVAVILASARRDACVECILADGVIVAAVVGTYAAVARQMHAEDRAIATAAAAEAAARV